MPLLPAFVNLTEQIFARNAVRREIPPRIPRSAAGNDSGVPRGERMRAGAASGARQRPGAPEAERPRRRGETRTLRDAATAPKDGKRAGLPEEGESSSTRWNLGCPRPVDIAERRGNLPRPARGVMVPSGERTPFRAPDGSPTAESRPLRPKAQTAARDADAKATMRTHGTKPPARSRRWKRKRFQSSR